MSDSLQLPYAVARQTPLSMGFSRQEYWSGLPFPPPGGLPDPGIEPGSRVSSALAGGFFTMSSTWKAHSTNWGALKSQKETMQGRDLTRT